MSTLLSLFLEQAARTPQRVAVRDFDCGEGGLQERRAFTFDQLQRCARATAATVAVPEIDLVAVCGTGVGAIIGVLAAWYLGRPYLPLDPNHPPARILELIGSLGNRVSVIIAADNHLHDIGVPIVEASQDPDLLGDCALDFKTVKASPLAYTAFTSGSTGTPKAVAGSHQAMIHRFRWMMRAFPIGERDTVAHTKSVAFLDYVWEVFGTLCSGGVLAVVPLNTRHDIRRLSAFIAEVGCTRITLVPSVLEAMLETAAEISWLAGMKLIIVSGEPIYKSTADKFSGVNTNGTVLLNLYGLTELAADCTYCVLSGPGAEDLDSQHETLPVGKPLEVNGNDVLLLGADGRLVDPGEVGELIVLGPLLGEGYCDGDAAGGKFFQYGDARALHTGDMGFRCVKTNLLYLTGRAEHDSVKNLRGGVRINLMEVEGHMRRVVPGDAVAYIDEQHRLTAFFEVGSHSEGRVLTRMVRERLVQSLPLAMVPSRIIPVEGVFPRLESSGKIDRRRLLLSNTRGQLNTSEPVNKSSVSALICSLLSNHTVDDIPMDTPLVELGIDSIAAMVFKHRLIASLGEMFPSSFEDLALDFAEFDRLTVTILNDRIMSTKNGGGPEAVSQAGVSSCECPPVPERDGRLPPELTDLRKGGISCCASGHVEGVIAAMEKDELGLLNAVDKQNSTALMWAAGNGHTVVVGLLLSKGHNTEYINMQNKQGRTALMIAAKNGRLEVVEMLIEKHKADMSIRMKDGSSLFDWAVFGGDIRVMEYLLAKGDAAFSEPNRFGCTPVHWAAASGNVETCKWLRKQEGFDFSALNNARHGLVSAAAWKGHEEVVKWAVDYAGLGWQMTVPDAGGSDAIQRCREAGWEALAEWMESRTDAACESQQ
eukprot:Hpha_TRINITY_DN14892_c1_g4::TRINITY_DN14892_c1_g4_i1::g.169231::m.169231